MRVAAPARKRFETRGTARPASFAEHVTRADPTVRPAVVRTRMIALSRFPATGAAGAVANLDTHGELGR